MFDNLRKEGREEHSSRCKHTISDTTEKQDRDADDIREPLGHVRVIPIEYIARGRVTVA